MTGSGRDPGVTGCWAAGTATHRSGRGPRPGRGGAGRRPRAGPRPGERHDRLRPRPGRRGDRRPARRHQPLRTGQAPSLPVDRNALRLHEREHLAALIGPRLRKFRALASRRIGRRLGSRKRRGDVHGQVCWPGTRSARLRSRSSGSAGTASAADPAVTIGADGKTAPVFDYTQAVRERVYIPQPGMDQDRNDQMDFVTADIIRPKESGAEVKVPAIIDPSPYFTTLCRGNESQCMADWDDDGVNDRWPLFYDNYFVPRGYAYVLGQMLGTGYTTEGCPNHGGPEDIAGEKSIVDWLNGRAPGLQGGGRDVAGGRRRLAQRQLGDDRKSYDGTLANGVAATGVEGLKTIVPISAICLVRLLAHGGRAAQQQLPGRQPQPGDHDGLEPAPGREPPEPPAAVRRVQHVRQHDRRGLAWRRQRVLARPRLRQGREQHQGRGVRDARLPGRQRPHEPARDVVGRAEGQRRAAQAVAHAYRPHRPLRVAPRGVGRHAARLVRPLPARRRQRHRRRAGGLGRGREGRLARVLRLAGPWHVRRRRVPARHEPDRARHARSHGRRQRRGLAVFHR